METAPSYLGLNLVVAVVFPFLAALGLLAYLRPRGILSFLSNMSCSFRGMLFRVGGTGDVMAHTTCQQK